MPDRDEGASAAHRREAVLELLLERGKVSIQDLTERFGVSAMTVHRDLDAMQSRGVLRKVRGGATVQPTAHYEGSLAYRLGDMQDAKQAIGRAAAAHVEPGSSVVLDDSTTALAMLPHLAGIAQLTLVTNFVSIAEEVARMTDSSLTLIMTGGEYHPKYHSLGGPGATRALRDLRVDRCFLSVAAMDVDRGAYHQETEQAILKRTMIEIADEAVLLVDGSKFAKRALHRIVGREAFGLVIVDDQTDPATVERLRAGGPVEVAPLAVEDGR